MTSAPSESALVELRRYTLHPGQRDTLIELFDREFIETQEAVGMRVIGQFRDLDDDKNFVWLRGFADRDQRRAGLEAFYGGPVWQAHRDAANATMVDSDNVFLLRPAWPGAGIDGPVSGRAAPGAASTPPGLLDASVFPLRAPAGGDLLALCREVLSPVLRQGGARRIAWYVTASTPNNFPRLPVREGEPVLVGLALFDDLAAFDAFGRGGTWARDAQPALAPWLAGPAESHRLVPTARSALHG
ncbi:MAG: NIPSNAP family protein [Hydrogenophaga sp.]|uniref:NIPSNAP family protein n=1 Tax=Hydrogenophaga sp. TaxID=1904254 RepID=UPI002636B155|nr:NIPSNAP family protein [Hydrogenophaga sp.]MCV0438055.1 NIPSNAP family protein [Hydrogenophaga sp.]